MLAHKIDDANEFMRALGLTPDNTPALRATRGFREANLSLVFYGTCSACARPLRLPR